MKMNIDSKKYYMEIYRDSLCAGIIERLFSFAYTLGCGYAASSMLDMAMAQNKAGILYAGLILLALLVIGLPITWLLAFWANRVRLWDRQKFREEIYQRMLSNRLEVFSLGEQEQLLGDVAQQITAQFQERIPKMVEGVCIVTGATVLICMENFGIGLLFALMALLQMIPIFTYEKWTKKIYEESWDSDEAEMDWIAQGIDGVSTLKSYHGIGWYIERYREINRRGIKVGNKAAITGGVERVLFAAIAAVLKYGSYVILGWCVLYQGLAVSSLPIMIVLSGYVFSSMDRLLEFFRYRSTYNMAFQRFAEAIREIPVPERKKNIQLQNVSKSFGDRQILQDISICIQEGERIRISGQNGSGKSTLLKIILGELTPDSGAVHCGMRVSVALQTDPRLSVSADSFIAALEKQPDWSIDCFRMHLQNLGFQEEELRKPIQELSGGECKKLFLSVALAREADLLILDEPTNHLDAESRSYLATVLEKCDCALLVCTHDPTLCVSWDKVLHMEAGERDG